MTKTAAVRLCYLVFMCTFFAGAWVHSAMHRLSDKHFMGVTDFKTPFVVVAITFFFLQWLLVLASLIWMTFFRRLNRHLRALSLASLCIVLLVALIGAMPCFYNYAEILTLDSVIAKSLLCPRYAIPSYIYLIAVLFPALFSAIINEVLRWRST